MRNSLLLIALASLLAFQPGPVNAEGTFKQAVADYNAGKYREALDAFNGFKAKYPDNALTHYYLALCHQALNHQSQAKAEYEWVSAKGDSTLKAHAAAGLKQISGLKMQVGSPSASVQPSQLPPGNQPAAAGGATKVKKVFEFYADW